MSGCAIMGGVVASSQINLGNFVLGLYAAYSARTFCLPRGLYVLPLFFISFLVVPIGHQLSPSVVAEQSSPNFHIGG